MYRTEVLCSNPKLRGYWFAVAQADEVAPGPRPVELLGERFVVWRDGAGLLAAAHDRCPHREAPLSLGQVVDGCLQCPYHGWEFGADGVCVLVPSSGPNTVVPSKAYLSTVNSENATDSYGCASASQRRPFPISLKNDDPDFRRINNPVERWTTSATRMADNFMDIAHFPWVHSGTFGRAQDTLVPKIELQGARRLVLRLPL